MKNFFGTWITSFSLPVCDLISSKKFSWICIDMEHSNNFTRADVYYDRYYS